MEGGEKPRRVTLESFSTDRAGLFMCQHEFVDVRAALLGSFTHKGPSSASRSPSSKPSNGTTSCGFSVFSLTTAVQTRDRFLGDTA
jgi:hypothetical protein